MKKVKKILSAITSAALAVSFPLCSLACSGNDKEDATPVNEYEYDIPQDYCRTYYEIFVRSFSDGNGDGIGDLRGLINNLDYLNDGDDSTTEDLGINGIWLMPIHPTGSYHGYDVTDYKGINPYYGTLDDFDELIEECEKRGIWVQIDLVLNHTSKNHPWFKEAIKEARRGTVEPEESEYMKKYEFYHKGEQPSGAQYSEVANSDFVYVCNFDESMPDLNLKDRETNGLKEEIESIVEFWINRGVHSFRLDAVPYACNYSTNYNDANGEFWTWFNNMCDEKAQAKFGKPDDGINSYCYNVGEVWASNSQIRQFFGTGMSNFNYDMGGSGNSMFANVPNGFYSAGAGAYAKYLANMQADVLSFDPDALLSNFLSNHDNDRSAGYFMYDPEIIKRAAGLYLLAPGNPYIYYGEELGAEGTKPGENDPDSNRRMAFNWGDTAKGVTKNPPYTNYKGMNDNTPYDSYKNTQRLGSWQDQTEDANSVLTYYRRAIQLRNRFPEIGRGVMTAYAVDGAGKLVETSSLGDASLNGTNALNKTIAAYTLKWGDRQALIVQNLGDEAATLDISAFDGYKVVGELKANGGSVAQDGGTLTMSASTVAVLKIEK